MLLIYIQKKELFYSKKFTSYSLVNVKTLKNWSSITFQPLQSFPRAITSLYEFIV